MIKVIIFDLWDTIGSKGFAINKEFVKHFNLDVNPENHQKYEEAIQLKRWNSKEEMVTNLLNTFNLSVKKDNINYLISLYDKGMSNAKLIEGMQKLLSKLSKEYKLALISNTTNFEIVFIDKFDIKKFFETIIFSHDVGKLKPSKEFFEKISSNLSNNNFSEFLFIDDSKKNIEGAEKLGIQTILFKDAEKLKEDLIEYNIR